MPIPTVTILAENGELIAECSLLQFARDNGRDVTRDVIAQFRHSLATHDRAEPAVIGGGAAPLFYVLY